MITTLQVIAFFFSLLMIYISLLNYRRGEIIKIEFFSWLTIWIVTIFIVIFPEIIRQYSTAFSVARLFDLMIVGGFIFVIVMAASSYLRVRKLEKKITKLIKKEAIKNFKNKQ